MAEVKVSQEEYELLKRQANAYRDLMAGFYATMALSPLDEIVRDFQATGLYTEAFLHDLDDGLRKSSLADTQ